MSVTEGNTVAAASQAAEVTAWDACQRAAKALEATAQKIAAAEGTVTFDQRLGAWLGLAESWRHLAETMNGGADSKRCILPQRPKDEDDRGR